MFLTFCSWHFGCSPKLMLICFILFSENAVLNVPLTSAIYGRSSWMAQSQGPLRERARWTSKEPRQLSRTPCSPAGLCWARRNLGADLVILPLWTYWNGAFTFCAWQESIFIKVLVRQINTCVYFCLLIYFCCMKKIDFAELTTL